MKGSERGAAAVAALPESVRVGAFLYIIEKWHPTSAYASERNGECSHSEFTIRIHSALMSATKAVDTVLHEISHAIFYQYCIMDDDKEERIVTTTARAWTQVYHDNPWLLIWIGNCFKIDEGEA